TTAINVTTINVSGATYTFTGGQNLNITNGISVTDSGVATFDKVAGELKNVYIAGTASKLTISSGDVTVNAFSSEGTFTTVGSLAIKSAVANGGSVVAGGNVTLASGSENVFGSLNATGKVTGASKLTVGGASAIGSVEGIGTLALNGGTLSLGNASGLANTQLGGALTLTGEAVNLGSVTMTNGSSISSSKVVVANGITVSGTGTVKGGATLQTASVGGTGTLAVEDGTVGIASGSTMSVSGVLDVKSGAHISNSGTLAVTNSGRVIAGNGVSLGTVDAKGAVELDGAAVSATGGSIAALDMGSGETLTVANDLALASTTGGNGGSLNVAGALTVGGAATIGNVTAGTLELTTAGTLTASGTLDAGTITLDRVSKTDHYLTAGGLSESTTAFVVDKALIEALNVSAGQIITLADLDTVHTGAANLTINGAKYITDTHDLGYHIAQDSVTKDIILIARNQESNYVWVGVNENWSDAANWSGGMVPDETSWVQFNGGEQSILLDQLVQTRRLTVSAGTHDTIYGDQNLLLSQSLEVDGNASLNVGDGSTETMVSAPEVQVTGELNVQANAFVDAEHTTIKGGALNVADGGSYFTGVVDMTEGGSLYTEGEASIAAEQLNGDSDSTVGGNVTIYGNGGRYSGGYDGAHISVVQDANATLYAGEGLTLHGDGTAKLLYTGNTAIDGVDADDLDIVLNDTTASSIGSTLILENASRMAAGSISFGMSAVDSAATIRSQRIPIILAADDFAVGDETTVVVSQDRIKDTGIAMAVWNDDYTQDLVLARVGADNTDTESVVLDGYLYNKYYKNARIEHGNLTVDMRDDFYTTISGAHTPAGISGAGMLDNAFVELNPQISNPNGDLAAVMTSLEYGTIPAEKVDSVLAAMSGTSHAAMGTAWSHDVDRQLRAIRNRTTSMGVGECVVNEDMPFVNAWINAEGDYSKFNNDGTLAGYKLSSWGGTFGVDVDCTNRLTMGLAVTAMNGDFTALGDDNAEGDLDRMYVSVFGRYARGSWTHTLVATVGMADTNLKRTVDYGTGSYATESSSDGTAYGVMYEAGYAIALNESASTCLQPVFNVSYRHSSLDGFTETGDTDAALRGGDAASDVVSIAVGARLQSIVGTSVYNRSSIFEGRVLFKFDAGDRDTAMHSSFMDVRRVQDVRSAEMGCFGLELGAGIVVPVAEDGGSFFFDVTAELRDKYTEVNGTAGYRYNF
ncbi:MAG: autotransporter domain-containing protein, partial [Akkermansia sp.]|nr:autotransporter domain-containing protein [Akkermansia sp.]